MTLGSGVVVGPFNFPIIRILVLVGVGRVIIRGERLTRGLNSLDWTMLGWAAWALVASFFHVSGTLVHHLGLTYNACGIYFLLRVFCQSVDDVMRMAKITALLLVPLSLAMCAEATTGHNLFASFGGVDALAEVRNGRIRAQGPFAHSILAGTVGGVTLPMMVGLWATSRKTAMMGVIACSLMVITSASSGPIMSVLFGATGLLCWRLRNRMRLLRWLAVLAYVVLDLGMKAPAYYLLARIDLTGSSTSWHRAELIDTALRHFSEWWLVGTDVTRHWMAYGVGWSGDQIDITNYYLNMGVWGGLPLMILFIYTLAKGFSFVGRATPDAQSSTRFMIWALGAALFAHAATFVSVSYFDQSVVFLYLTLAAISSVSDSIGSDVSDRESAAIAAPASSLPRTRGAPRSWTPTRSAPTFRPIHSTTCRR